MVIDTEGLNPDKPMVWPDYPERARFKYVGQLTGERNFQKSTQKSGTRKFFEMVVGVITGARTRVGLQRPQCGVVDEDGRVYVTDISRQAVFVFDNVSGQLHVWEMAGPMTLFLSPIGIALDGDGGVFVADSELGYVVKLDKTGSPTGTIGENQLIRPTGIAFDAESKTLFVVDTHAHNIKVFDHKGVMVRTIGKRGESGAGLNFPTHITYSTGKLYISDTANAKIQIFRADGEYIGSFGRRGLYVGNFTRPKGVATDSRGNVYVVESYYDHLLVYDKDGRFLLPMGGSGSGPGKFYLPAGVWTDRGGRVFVADMFNRRIVIFQFIGIADEN